MKSKPPFNKSILFAWKGLVYMVKSERNFKIEFLALLINVILIFLLDLNLVDAILILICCFTVLAAEMINTSVEKLCDFLHPTFHPKIGLIKDISAGAVFLLAILSVVVGVLVYLPYVEILFLF
ncbi:diacylglycerol kinase family protein [Amniculibacterium sp. G2-70]|uniref:diacylglycerol kinase family protein n=1 Tax=Amniculibacterium sp. G2-70 TaxID=2767188 RepID=UPI00165492B4|nr:diacylglycerol kinase family protein [Amniculibacterium sp. G2-70]